MADYQKDLSHTTWEAIYERQTQRAEQVEQWLDALNLHAGDRVLDTGSGPGYASLRAAERVGPEGVVYAVDSSAEALAYLEHLQAAQGVTHIRRIVADAATATEPPAGTVDAALATMMLHHCDDPAALLGNVARMLRPGGRVVVAEFDPSGDCAFGPPREHRLPPEQVRTWCEGAGLRVLSFLQQTSEHYMFLAEREGER